MGLVEGACILPLMIRCLVGRAKVVEMAGRRLGRGTIHLDRVMDRREVRVDDRRIHSVDLGAMISSELVRR